MKIKAFTILEALISLILISIVIGLIFMLLNFMNKQMAFMARDNTTELEYHLFNTTFQRDINHAIDFNMTNDILTLENYDQTQIRYTFSKEAVFRDTQITKDTFNFQIISKRAFENDLDSFSNLTLEADIGIMNDTIHTMYYIKRDVAKHINNTYYHEN